MKDDLQVFLISPGRNLRGMRDHKVDISYKRHIHLDSPKQILQRPPVTETLLHHRDIRVRLIVLLPERIIAIYICNNYIHTLFIRSTGCKCSNFQQQKVLKKD